jgi:RNA polymerase primary sigma factor
MVALINQWRRTTAELEGRLGASPDVEDVANVMHLPLRKAKIIHQIVKILGSVRDAHSADDSTEEDTLEASLEDQHTANPEDELVADEERTRVLRLLNEIEPREAGVLRLHYGLDGRRPLTLRQIGEKFGLTRERIRQIQRAALTKLYEYMNEE